MKTKSEFSPRRIKLVFELSILTSLISLIWAIMAHYFEIKQLDIILAIATVSFFIAAIITKKGGIILARMVYMITFIVSVSAAASFIGKAGSVEFVLMFALGLPFLIFSFRHERLLLYSFSLASSVIWLLLYVTNFNLYTDTHMDPVMAGNFVYPVSVGTIVLLTTYQLVVFSQLNMGYYKKILSKREDALEASNAKSKFLSTMSHEIRTPLNAIIGLSHILGENDPKPEQVENIEALNYSGKILLNLLNNVLDFSKMESNEIILDPIPTDIHIAVKQLKKIYEANCMRKGISMFVDVEEDLPIVCLDIVRYNQVVNNLISNAIKFTDNGSVTLKIYKENETKDDILLVTEVIDTGIGLTDEQQLKIFDAFTQATKSTTRLYGGTGLGLSIVKKIIDAMDSKINIKSKIGYGSTFYLKINLKKSQSEKPSTIIEKSKHNLNGKRILLVDDNLINIMVGKQLLEKEGVIVDTAENGQEAVNLVKSTSYDAVLMDIQMPIMDGYTATIEIRKFNTTLPILALSASVLMEIKNKILECGMNGFILKPFVPEDLLNEIDEQINNFKHENVEIS